MLEQQLSIAKVQSNGNQIPGLGFISGYSRDEDTNPCKYAKYTKGKDYTTSNKVLKGFYENELLPEARMKMIAKYKKKQEEKENQDNKKAKK